ncbi:hypothetical protein HG535_0H01090 [Zygotorulaspora mrakii]|uniref:GPI-anchored wall transfer protein n=1 Tax=Zygotorulaspora mrakii TaxID=42260 RepID=A0A7H9BAN1_ZYGMR|nr:uncharacterized protein HG535_0H01090 [Zygotorulaspora mrakii]QLG74782.1 hypothetical protein HG535_0H01090 [Zygotorulaspora mrakii]
MSWRKKKHERHDKTQSTFLLMSTLKERKENFVADLSGGTISEINLVTSIALVSYFCWHLLSIGNDVPLLVDFALNWICLLLSITIYSDNVTLLYSLIIFPTVMAFLITKSKSSHSRKVHNLTKKYTQDERFQLVKRPFITAYRGGMLIVTVLAILAVDFRVFPRRFAKVETWGTSMMDLGVGSFVFSNGIVSSRVILKHKLFPKSKPSLKKRSFDALRAGGTLLLIGLLRLYFVKNLEYQEHVTEYGVHWNFFITLAFLPPVLVFLDPIAERVPRCLIALVISLLYETILVCNEKALKFLIMAPRNTFFSSNREGIASFLGYCSIFLIGQSTGFYCLGNVPTKNNLYKASIQMVYIKKRKVFASFWDRITTVSPSIGLLIWTIFVTVLAQIVFSFHPYDVSRRFANLPYVIWVCAYNLGFLFIYSLIDATFGTNIKGYKVPLTLEAFNSNGLIMFLLANVSTGLINMCFSTIDASKKQSVIALLAYAAFLAIVSLCLYQKGIFIKL